MLQQVILNQDLGRRLEEVSQLDLDEIHYVCCRQALIARLIYQLLPISERPSNTGT